MSTLSKPEKKAAKKAKRAGESRARKWSRRGFITAGLVTGGALAVGVAIRPGHMEPKLAKYVTGEGEHLVTAWVKIARDNTVTAIIPHSEMGQGVHTALSAMLAEEMDVDWEKMVVIEAPAEKEYANYILGRDYIMNGKTVPGFVQESLNGAFMQIAKGMDLQITGGSCSVRFTGAGAMQVAGAAARELLMKTAAKTWDVPLSELRTAKSYIYHDGSGKSAPYAEFAQGAAKIKPNLNPTLKARKDYTVMGQSLPRIDLPPKVDGTAMFGIDADVPGMKYATLKAAPVLGNKVAKLDAAEAKAMPGVIGIYNMGDFVAVVADGYWQAKQALGRIEVTFETSGNDSLSQADIFAQYSAAIDTAKAKKLHKVGDAGAALAGAASIYEASYQVPYLAHACMEPMNATAWVRDGKCDIWTGTQNPLGTRSMTAKALGMDFKNVTVHNHFMGGGFGRRAVPDYSDQAALISQKSGLPVKLIWSREEDMQHDHYRPSAISRFRVGLDENKMPIAWDNIFVHKHDPAEASLIPYNIPAQNIRYVESPTHIRFGPWRSVDHTQHGFFTESLIDELSYQAGMDGYKFRRKLLEGKPRHIAVLDAAAKKAGWGKALPEGQAQGISIVESFMTIVAQVVTVDMTGAEPRAVHVACAADAGMAVNPDGFTAQMESGIIYGLTAALYGEISIAAGAVEQSNFHDYRMVRMDNAPEIDVVILQSDAPLGGAGEPGTPPITPALANAIFAATGKRVRSLPIMNTEFGPAS